MAAAFYGTAYILRSIGLGNIADPLFGAMLGAATGLVWVVLSPIIARAHSNNLKASLADRGPWHWAAALALGVGQTLQFVALSAAPVSIVAVLGALDVFFAASLLSLFAQRKNFSWPMLIGSGGIALFGLVVLLT